MVTAFILIVVKSGTEKGVVDALSDMEEVQEANIVYGQYDIIAKIELEDIAALSGFLLNKVRIIEGIVDSSTLISTY